MTEKKKIVSQMILIVYLLELAVLKFYVVRKSAFGYYNISVSDRRISSENMEGMQTKKQSSVHRNGV